MNPKSKISLTAIILAAGLSRRMGDRNKLLLPFEKSTIVERVIQQVKRSHASELVIVASELVMSQLLAYQADGVTVVDNPQYQSGMTSSIQTGVAQATSDGYMICLGDQPLIPTQIYDQLIDAFQVGYLRDPRAMVLPFYKGKKGNPVIFSSHYRQAIQQHTAPDGCKEIVQLHKEHLVKVNVSSSSVLYDVDTPADYLKLPSSPQME